MLSRQQCVFVVAQLVLKCGFKKKRIELGIVSKYSEWLASPVFVTEVVTLELPPQELADRAAQLSPRRFHIVTEVISVPWRKKKEKTVRFMVLGGRAWESLKDSAAGFYCCCQPLPTLPDFDRSPPDP